MSWLATFVLVTTFQCTFVAAQEAIYSRWGFLTYSAPGRQSQFVARFKKDTNCIFLRLYTDVDSPEVTVDDTKVFVSKKLHHVCNRRETRIKFPPVPDTGSTPAEFDIMSIFYRILDVGEFSVGIETICSNEKTCTYERKETETNKTILLTSPIVRRQSGEKVFNYKLKLRNDTIALIDVDPSRIGLDLEETLRFHGCESSETLFIVNETLPTRRTIFKHFGSDLCITYNASKSTNDMSNFVMPCQLVQLFLTNQESESRTAYFNVPRRSTPSVDILALKGDPQIQETTSFYICHFAQLGIADVENNILMISKGPDLRSNVSLELTRADGEDDIFVKIIAFDLYVAVLQHIAWKNEPPSNKSLSTYVAGIGCEQQGDAAKSPDDRYNSGAVFCVYVKIRIMKNSENNGGENLWSKIKESIRDGILKIVQSKPFLNRTALLVERDQIEIPKDNPVVYASQESGQALVRLAFVITKEGGNTPALNQEIHHEILKVFERQCQENETSEYCDNFTFAPSCRVEISLMRNLIFFGLLVLICFVTFGAIWRCQLNSDVQRRVIAQINEGKRRKSETDYWDSGTLEAADEGPPPETQEQYMNQAFINGDEAQASDQVIQSKLKGTSLAMKSFRRNGLAVRRVADGGLPLSVPGGMGGQMAFIREEDETMSTSRM